MKVSVENLTLSVKGLPATIDGELHPHIAARCGIRASDVLAYRIEKRSVDARRKPDVKLIYSLVATIRDGADAAFPLVPAPEDMDNGVPRFECRNGLMHPIVIGSGPAGLFCALILAQAGCRPVVLERGKDVDRRHEDIDDFLTTRRLDCESNYLFGEGGAGTWSDGKLYTRVRDGRVGYVLDTFIRFGAPREIGYFSHPHLGSDRLPLLVSAIRDEIIALGGEFRWSTRAETILVKDNVCKGVVLADGETLEAPAVAAACGHSARKFILNLMNAGVKTSLKGFQIGCRIEHPQEMVDRKQYRCSPRPPTLGAAEYNLAMSPTPSKPGASTFCMCPGGTVIPATAVSGELSSNGMSNRARDGEFANSTIVVTPDRTKFKTHAGAFGFLSALGRKTFYAGGEDYGFPAQDADAFLTGNVRLLHKKSSVQTQLVPADISSLLPQEITATIRRALREFDRRFPGFIKYGKLIGVESYVSSPVRFIRDINMMSTVEQLYFAGEGAGMAGGILSAAVDGIKVAQAVIKKFNQI